MRIFLINIILFISLISCKQEPDFHPFNKVWNVDLSSIDEASPAWDGTGVCSPFTNYYILDNHFQPYYMTTYENREKAVGKGFRYVIDTIDISHIEYSRKMRDRYYEKLDSLEMNPFDIHPLNDILLKFDYVPWTNDSTYFSYINMETNDTIIAFLNCWSINKDSVHRFLHYTNFKYEDMGFYSY